MNLVIKVLRIFMLLLVLSCHLDEALSRDYSMHFVSGHSSNGDTGITLNFMLVGHNYALFLKKHESFNETLMNGRIYTFIS